MATPATPQSQTDTTATPRLRKYRKYVVTPLKYVVTPLKYIVGAFIFVAFVLYYSANSTQFLNSGVLFAFALAVVCVYIAHDHKLTGMSKSWVQPFWLVYGAFAALAAVLLLLRKSLPDFLGIFAFFPLVLMMLGAFASGTYYVRKYGKTENVTYTGYLHLIAACLTLTTTSWLGIWYSVGFMQAWGHFFLELSWLGLAGIILFGLIRAVAKRPDLQATEDDSKNDETPQPAPAAPEEHPAPPAAVPDDNTTQPHTGYFPLADDDTGPIPRVDSAGHPGDPARSDVAWHD